MSLRVIPKWLLRGTIMRPVWWAETDLAGAQYLLPSPVSLLRGIGLIVAPPKHPISKFDRLSEGRSECRMSPQKPLKTIAVPWS